jgi:hypothetical protein
MKIVNFFLKHMSKMVGSRAGAGGGAGAESGVEMFEKLKAEPQKKSAGSATLTSTNFPFNFGQIFITKVNWTYAPQFVNSCYQGHEKRILINARINHITVVSFKT